MRTTDKLGRWEGANADEAAENLSTLGRARKLYTDLSRSLEGEIDRIRAALEIETDVTKIKDLTSLIRENGRTLKIVLEMEAKLMCVADKQRPGEGVIDLAEARAEILRRLDRLAG